MDCSPTSDVTDVGFDPTEELKADTVSLQSEVRYLRFCIESEVEARSQAIADLEREVRPLFVANANELALPFASQDTESRIRVLEDQIVSVNSLVTKLEGIIVESVKNVVEEVKQNSGWVERTFIEQNRELEDIRTKLSSESNLWSRLDTDLQQLVQAVSKIGVEKESLPVAQKTKPAVVLSSSVASNPLIKAKTELDTKNINPLPLPSWRSSVDSVSRLQTPVQSWSPDALPSQGLPLPLLSHTSACSEGGGSVSSVPGTDPMSARQRMVSSPLHPMVPQLNMADACSRWASCPTTSIESKVSSRSRSASPLRGFSVSVAAKTQFERLPRLTSGVPWHCSTSDLRVSTMDPPSEDSDTTNVQLTCPPSSNSTPSLPLRSASQTTLSRAWSTPKEECRPISNCTQPPTDQLGLPRPSPTSSSTIPEMIGSFRCVAGPTLITTPRLQSQVLTPRAVSRGSSMVLAAGSPTRTTLTPRQSPLPSC